MTDKVDPGELIRRVLASVCSDHLLTFQLRNAVGQIRAGDVDDPMELIQRMDKLTAMAPGSLERATQGMTLIERLSEGMDLSEWTDELTAIAAVAQASRKAAEDGLGEADGLATDLEFASIVQRMGGDGQMGNDRLRKLLKQATDDQGVPMMGSELDDDADDR